MVLAVAYGVALSSPAAGTFHDDGIYAVSARALAEGQGYRIISLPEAPAQTKYPVLFPWLLSLVWRLSPEFPGNLWLLRLVPLTSTLVWLALAHLLLKTLGASKAQSLAVVAMTAASPWVVFLSTALMAETLFAALITGSMLLLAGRGGTEAVTWRRSAVAGLLAGLSMLTRAAGVAVACGALAWLLWRRRRANAAVFLGAALLVVAPWVLWVFANEATVDSYYSAIPYGTWNIAFRYTWPEKVRVLAHNAAYMAIAPSTILGWPLSPPLLLVTMVAVSLLVPLGAWLTRHHPATWCTAASVAMTAMWVWPPVRFLIPLLPPLLWFAVRPLLRTPAPLRAIGATAALAVALVSTTRVAATARQMGAVWPVPQHADNWNEVAGLMSWIRDHAAPDAIVAGNLDPVYFLFANRRAIRAFTPDSFQLYYQFAPDRKPLGTGAELRDRFLAGRVDYCVLTPARGFGESPFLKRLVDDLAARYPGSLTVVAGNPRSGYLVYAVDRNLLQ